MQQENVKPKLPATNFSSNTNSSTSCGIGGFLTRRRPKNACYLNKNGSSKYAKWVHSITMFRSKFM